MKFELSFLDNYDDDSLLDEIRRVAGLYEGERLTIAKFDVQSKVASTTVRRRFVSWSNALKKAGVKNKASMHLQRVEANKSLGKKGLAALIKKVAEEQQVSSLTRKQFSERSGIGQKAILARFGSWKEALLAAGLEPVPLGKRYTDAECYENLLSLWMHYGRQPKFGELKQHPSTVGPKAYVRRWGSWRNALRAFVVFAENDSIDDEPTESEVIESSKPTPGLDSHTTARTRHIPLRVRYNVLKRDAFKCQACGQSPANTVGIELHIDHIKPWSKGGSNEPANLATLCSNCNLGKGDQHDAP